jgi:hypothetical protein
MNDLYLNDHRWQKWAVFACVISVCIHIGAILGLKSFSIMPPLYRQKPLIEREIVLAEILDHKRKRKEISEKRSQELSMIFHALSLESLPIPLDPPLIEPESQTLELIEMEDDLSFELPNEIISAESLRFELGTLPSTFEIQNDPKTLLGEIGELEPLQPNHQAFGEELAQAMKPLFGSIVSDIAEPVALENSLTIGGLETTPLQGNSFSEREGLTDHGFTDLDEETSLVLMSSFEMETLKDELLKRAKGASTGTSFPLEPDHPPLPHGLGSYVAAKKSLEESVHPFSCTLVYAPKRHGTGYFFKLTFALKEENQLQRIPQNYFFLVDRSRSIRPQRYEMTKKAVAHALDFLQKGDAFNILVFDDKVDSFSTSLIPWSKKNVKKGKAFLDELKPARTFSSTDLQSSLTQLLQSDLKHDKVNTAILLSDGDTFLSRTKHRETIANWTSKNQGKISLFSVPVGKGNNIALLELLSVFNRGMLFHADSNDDVDETLSTLLYGIRNPLGKEIAVTAVFPENENVLSKQQQPQITLFPSQRRLPHLYEQVPYVIYGSIDRLENFHVFVQGRDRESTMTIKEFVDFSQVEPMQSQELERMWAIQQSYELYAQFLEDGNQQHLQTIKLLLSPYKLAAAFQ